MMEQKATIAVRAGIASDPAHHAVIPPLYLSTNFAFTGFAEKGRYDYTRSGNPTRDVLGDALAQLEGGASAVVTASGMAALTLITQILDAGDRILAPHDCYGGTFRLLSALKSKGRIQVDFVDQGDPTALDKAFSKDVALVLVETPSNPLLRVVDIAAIAARCKVNGAILAVDNTFLSPSLQNPIKFGADLVIHSTTKYLNGHSDVVGGAVIAAKQELGEKLSWWANCLGLTGAPFDSYLTLRGLRTLEPRLRTHLENTAQIVETLCQSAAVKKVYYPGLSDHPGHDIAVRQQRGFGAMVSFELKGDQRHVEAFLAGLRYFTLAESLGGVESLVAHPSTMTHASMTAEARAIAGISESLIRISVGIESEQDLTGDLLAALDRAQSV